VSQIVAGLYHSSNQLEDELPSIDEFEPFYARHHEWLKQDAWKQYYSTPFLAQATSVRFFRLPDLQDLPDSSDPLACPRPHRGTGYFTRLPRWSDTVARTRRRQHTLSEATLRQIALSTLQQTISRQREAGYPSVSPYSETQASFWLYRFWPKDMKVEYRRNAAARRKMWKALRFSVYLAQGGFDVWEWEARYSRERWNSEEARIAYLEPDLDGTRKVEVHWTGLPDGGVGAEALSRAWEPELGSEEEIDFLAAVAVKETEGVTDVGNLDYAMRSHMLWGVMRLAFESAERERYMEDLKRKIVEAGRLDDKTKAEQWIQRVLIVMEPYVRKADAQWPAAVEDQSELLRHILTENGQLFARWKPSPTSKEFFFELNPRQ
jgi:hypothetical protein